MIVVVRYKQTYIYIYIYICVCWIFAVKTSYSLLRLIVLYVSLVTICTIIQMWISIYSLICDLLTLFFIPDIFFNPDTFLFYPGHFFVQVTFYPRNFLSRVFFSNFYPECLQISLFPFQSGQIRICLRSSCSTRGNHFPIPFKSRGIWS